MWLAGNLRSPGTVEALVRVLFDADVKMRALAATSLAKIGDLKAVAAMRQALAGADKKTIGIINAAIRALERRENGPRDS